MESVFDMITKSIEHVSILYFRLIILVGSAEKDKAKLLNQIHQATGAPIFNINLELSRRMLDLTERQRVLKLNRLLADLVDSANADVVLLDNIEILFDINLKQDPLKLLQALARGKTIIVAWNGRIDEKYLYYATYEHPEYKKYPLQDYIAINIEEN